MSLTNIQPQTNFKSLSPSSTTTARFPSGDRPTQVMFLVVERGKVSEVLLLDTNQQTIGF